MGTYYAVTCQSCTPTIKESIDSLLIQLNQELSTYIPTSIISTFNQSSSGIDYEDATRFDAFFKNLAVSTEINQQSEGAFDPSLMPIINYWGFGYTHKNAVEHTDSLKVDSLFAFVGLEQISIDTQKRHIHKTQAGTQLDFSALAKGYGVDLVAEFLNTKNIHHYLVDIGGESRAKGLNAKGKQWTLGINTPKVDAGLTEAVILIQLRDKSLATSGNYRNFYERKNGEKYSHTIDALTGYPSKSDILSASVISDDCIYADAWATAFMAMGLSKSKTLVEDIKHIEALFIYNDSENMMDTWHSSGFDQYILNQ